MSASRRAVRRVPLRAPSSPRFRPRRRPRRGWAWLIVIVALVVAAGVVERHHLPAAWRVRLERVVAALPLGHHLIAPGGKTRSGHRPPPPPAHPSQTGKQAGSGGTSPPSSSAPGSSPGASGSTSSPPPSLPEASVPGASAVLAFYRDVGSGNLAAAYALATPSWQAQQSLSAFEQSYAGVTGATVMALNLQSAGNFSRTFSVTVRFDLGSQSQVVSGTVTAVDLSGGSGAPDWHLNAPSFAPSVG